MAQSTPPRGQPTYPGSAAHDIKERATDQFERMADKATDRFKSVADQAEDVANRVAEQGREVGQRVEQVAGNFKGAVDKSIRD